MTRVTIDTATASALSSLQGTEIELLDQAGNVVGWYAPNRRVTMQEVIESCPSTKEELQKQLEEESGHGRSWAEIRKDLESR